MSVRWDAVVDLGPRRSQPEGAVVYRTESPAPPEAGASFAASAIAADGPVSVDVWLYGSLSGALDERPVTLRLGNPFRITDIIAELARRHGEQFRQQLTDDEGRPLLCCRVFIDGDSVEDLEAPLYGGAAPAKVEMILLGATEGG